MAETKTDEYLSALFADSYKRELDADEAIWRSLPFFAAILGLAVAVLPSIYRSAFSVRDPGWTIAVVFLLVGSVGCFVIAGRWFWDVIRLRDYRYPPNDVEILDYAQTLGTFYQDIGKKAVERDGLVRDDLRTLMIGEFADAATRNRRNNVAKAKARSQVLLFVMTGFLLAFCAEATILLAEAFTTPSERCRPGGKANAGSAQNCRNAAAPAKAAAAQAPYRARGRELHAEKLQPAGTQTGVTP